jgi:hypothetical protein
VTYIRIQIKPDQTQTAVIAYVDHVEFLLKDPSEIDVVEILTRYMQAVGWQLYIQKSTAVLVGP